MEATGAFKFELLNRELSGAFFTGTTHIKYTETF